SAPTEAWPATRVHAPARATTAASCPGAAKLRHLVFATERMRMQQPDEKQRAASVPVGNDEAWRRLLAAPKPAVVEDHGVLGFFVELMPEEGAAFARADVAPVLLTVAEHGRYSRPVPLDSRHLAHSPLQPHEQRLAASVLGLPQSVRKSRSYARLGGHVGDTLLAEILDTAPC